MHNLRITMLGPRGVGKTSLLTAMYEQFESSVGSTNLQLTPDLESAAMLQDRLAELKSLTMEFEPSGGLRSTEAPAGPSSLRSFTFSIGKKGKTSSLRLDFEDFPGGYLASGAAAAEKAHVKELVSDCHAVLVAIDAPALMESSASSAGVGRWHERINRPQQITDLFKHAYGGLDSPRLVILAPVKCEKYVQTSAASAELLQAVRHGYAKLLSLLADDSLRSKVSVVVTPVQTVGTVVFSRVELIDNIPHFRFRKTSHDATYSPKDSEQPLRYLLQFLLNMHIGDRRWSMFNFLRDIFGRDDHLKDAARSFAAGAKRDGGFAALQRAAGLS